MKKSILLTLLVIGVSASIISCTKKSSSSTTTPATNSMTGNGGSTSFAASTVTTVILGNTLTISGTNTTNYESMSVIFTNFNGSTGSWNLGTPMTTNGYGYWTANARVGTEAYSVSGTAIITAISPNIVGTFSFTCNDSTKVTSGAFNVQHP